MSISSKIRKTLWARSGNRCAFCQIELVQEKDEFNRTLNLGEECHIISKKSNGPRNVFIKDFNYDSAENLLLLCCNHHTMIDEKVEKYPTSVLIELKNKHELWVKNNLDKNFQDDIIELSEEEKLVSYITTKHDKEMKIKSSKEILYSEKGLDLAYDEIEKIKNKVSNVLLTLKESAPKYNIIHRFNNHKLCDIIFNKHTLMIQYYQASKYYANNSYLLFGIVNGLFDKNGYPDPYNPPTSQDIIRLDFTYNEIGDFGWKDQENNNEFYTSNEITEQWLKKFFRLTLK
jgi:HNH endonuclease